MPRANRYFVPNTVWHLTHRCHKKEFLLKFAKDKKRWLYWLYQAKKKFNISILNFCITSNHVHLLITASDTEAISKSIQLIAGRTAYEYNLRKGRSGAFWEDRYHATAVEGGKHLLNCIAYIDMNMVRAGVVLHPKEWKYGGYNQLIAQPMRYSMIDYAKLIEWTGFDSLDDFISNYNSVINSNIAVQNKKNDKWTSAIAVGSESFVIRFKSCAGIKAINRKIKICGDTHILKENFTSYNTSFDTKNNALRGENTLFWHQKEE